jgi:hypothetical protein
VDHGATSSDRSGQRHQPSVPAPADFGLAGALVATLAALLLAMHELSALSSGFLSTDGKYWSFEDMSGPSAWRHRSHWSDVLTDAQLGNWREMLVGFAAIDAVFFAVYTFALLRLFGKISTHPQLTAMCRVRRVIWALALVEVVELVGQLSLAWQRCGSGAGCEVPTWLVDVVTVVTMLKWALVLVLVGSLVWAWWRARGTVAERARDLWPAVKVQRFSLLAFLPIALLAVLPLGELNNMFDQLPDVQRAWLDGGDGLRDAVLAAAVFGLAVMPAIFSLGRIRADWATRRAVTGGGWPFRNTDGTARPPKRWVWLVGPIFFPALAVLNVVRGGEVFWGRLIVFCAVPLAVVALSWAVKRLHWQHPATLPDRSPRFPSDTMAVGDVITVAAVSLTGLGMVRAFTGLEVLGATDLLTYDYAVSPLVPALLGLVVAVGPWLLAPRVLGALARLGARVAARDDVVVAASTEAAGAARTEAKAPSRWSRSAVSSSSRRRVAGVLAPGIDVTDPGGQDQRRAFKIVMMVVSVGLFVLLAAGPRAWANWLGALGAATLAMATLVVLLGVLVAYIQDRQPPELFQVRVLPQRHRDKDGHRLRSFRSTPVVSLLFIALVVTAWVGGPTDVHPISVSGGNDADGVLPERLTMDETFDAWLAQDSGSCHLPFAADGAFTVRPMLMIAAEGGGIRATYWTAAALDRIGAAGSTTQAGCGRRATLFSGGASGGALGLVLGRFAGDPLEAADAMSGPNALSQAMVSLVSSDLLASATGVRFETDAPHRTPDRQALDRAGLMETAWEDQPEAAELRTEFLPEDPDDATSGDGAVTGQLILTATEARNGCRPLLSQVDLSEGASFDQQFPVCGDGAAGPDSYDIFAAYGRTSAGDDAGCIGNVPALTAGLLASRFPYVTPSGVVGGCRGLAPSQLIDGGYTDNTGLGTILGLQDSWSTRVQTHNDEVLAAGTGELVVPMVVYLENGTGSDFSLVTDAKGEDPLIHKGSSDLWWRSWEIPELLIPPIGGINGRDHRVKTRTALKASVTAMRGALCSTEAEGCEALRAGAGQQVFVVQQYQQPSVPAPLGWVMSKASRADLDADIAHAAESSAATVPKDPGANYGSLHDLLVALGGSAP